MNILDIVQYVISIKSGFTLVSQGFQTSKIGTIRSLLLDNKLLVVTIKSFDLSNLLLMPIYKGVSGRMKKPGWSKVIGMTLSENINR